VHAVALCDSHIEVCKSWTSVYTLHTSAASLFPDHQIMGRNLLVLLFLLLILMCSPALGASSTQVIIFLYTFSKRLNGTDTNRTRLLSSAELVGLDGHKQIWCRPSDLKLMYGQHLIRTPQYNLSVFWRMSLWKKKWCIMALDFYEYIRKGPLSEFQICNISH
jgi:hypothetical protein